MRARIKHRQMIRRITLLTVAAVIIVSVVTGFYIALHSASGRDAYIGQTIPTSLYSSLYRASMPPFGSYGFNLVSGVKTLGGPTFYSSNHLPIVVYVGAEYCLYCAVTRWPLIMALMRFGNFTGLEYMTSSISDGDYSTFSFRSSSYQSKYIAFQAFELQARDGSTLATLPSNYTSSFSQQGGNSYPFLNFANNYYIHGALLDPSILGSKNWTTIISEISTADPVGAQIREEANVITATICKLTNGAPASVCSASWISLMTHELPSYSQAGDPAQTLMMFVAPPARVQNPESLRGL